MRRDIDTSWLPIGSVVQLAQDDSRLIIIGYMQREETLRTAWDYVSLRYPGGWAGPDSIIAFNRSDIARTLYIGYLGPERDPLLECLSEAEPELERLKSERGGKIDQSS
ncbi:hypothetical protein Corgl_0016 [Coriobacterium glomerans PW2]|uniref:DUF4176 domain-containing protein n=1 Tax=Coriobacterium glomerans (strain ATCC 49209 / DSM 20642 / JCM 10262 / PW2) TaxID=700015 RepID=F2N6U7_CORGP|nr:DUF4176 domain-containing protein [Coriobacterium glomerans]AEB06146.1 hypothetical protein Corgl_0016 [Coriobacterium glomerans PW2]